MISCKIGPYQCGFGRGVWRSENATMSKALNECEELRRRGASYDIDPEFAAVQHAIGIYGGAVLSDPPAVIAKSDVEL